MVYLRNLCLTQENKDFSMSSIRNFIVLGVIHFLVNLYMWYKVYLFIYLFANGCPIIPVAFVESISYVRQYIIEKVQY